MSKDKWYQDTIIWMWIAVIVFIVLAAVESIIGKLYPNGINN